MKNNVINPATNNVSLISTNEVTPSEAPTTNLQDTNSKILELRNVLQLSGAYLPESAKKSIEKEIETLTKQYNRLLGNDMLKAYLQPYIMKFRQDNNINDLQVKFNLKIENGQVLLEINDTTKQSNANDTNRASIELNIFYKNGTFEKFTSWTKFYYKQFDINETILNEIYDIETKNKLTENNAKDINSKLLFLYLSEVTGKQFKHANLFEKFGDDEIISIFENTNELLKISKLSYNKLRDNQIVETKELNFKF